MSRIYSKQSMKINFSFKEVKMLQVKKCKLIEVLMLFVSKKLHHQ